MISLQEVVAENVRYSRPCKGLVKSLLSFQNTFTSVGKGLLSFQKYLSRPFGYQRFFLELKSAIL